LERLRRRGLIEAGHDVLNRIQQIGRVSRWAVTALIEPFSGHDA